jgi:hypothetical protein
MRALAVVMSLGFGLWAATPALAIEHFIPQGHTLNYDNPDLPKFGSEAGQFDLQTDIYETEIYMQRRENKLRDSYFKRFQSNPEPRGGDTSIDY